MDKEKIKQLFQSVWSWIKRYKWLSIIVSSMFLLSVLGYLFIIFGGRFVFDEKAVILPTASKVVAEDGTVLGKLYSENRDYVTLEQIPDHVEEAFIAMEDQRFYEHAGISLPAVTRAVYRDIVAMSKVEGGSTITQQLAKNLFLVNDKTWMRKTKEVMASVYLERNYTKSQILELYLNQIYLAHGVHGVGTAADYYFGKDVADLSIEEGALLAAMVKAPNSYSPHHDLEEAKQRRDLVLQQMANEGNISTEQLLALQATEIKVKDQERQRDPWLDDYFAYVLEEVEATYGLSREALKRGGYTVEVHMDPDIQQIAYDQMQDSDYYHGSNDAVNGSFVLMEQKTGQLKALIAGRDFQLNDINHLLTKKQPGSVMKPLAVYGPAMQLGNYQPYDMIPDQDIEYDDGYRVNNVDGPFDGEVSMFQAVVESKNAPAVWLLDQIGVDYSKTMLEKMNIDINDQGLAIALGGLETGITPIEVAEGYRTFISGGEWLEARSVRAVYNKDQEKLQSEEQEKENVFNSQTAWNMLRMLEGVTKEGTGSAGEYSKALAGKTGSTQHPEQDGAVKDAWFAGITPEYVTATWIGYDQATAENYLTTGSEATTRLTKSILTEIDKRMPLAEKFEQPDDVEDLPEPIQLPVIDDLTASIQFGGFSILRGELNWTAAEDSRVIYRIYERGEDEDHLIGEAEGKGSYTIDRINVFRTGEYYVVPYNPLTKQTGKPSNITSLEFDF
ncbi:transglycosylase domain-containing protein [Gracilibacillus thailandensis]|uniref:PBP1A family penicillin-binding protein n=1 Tax=Gracilibacillus thailandensis TaxID=563735 RepID=A0A6N7QSD1_9BACI|nr:PBP1A family penicillin-binding protein [Gracilibacillus thailandensis]MRI65017.1 PBP1A family penicillin-binding protein [Gracilibacillus thailandensis]